MKLCVSNIAWQRHDDPAIFASLRDEGVQGIEIAPTKVWPEWEGATPAAGAAYRRRLGEEGFEVPSLQAIMFGRSDLLLFGNASQVNAFVDHIRHIADLAQALGAKALVYGAPKSRDRGSMTHGAAIERAADVLARAGEACAERGTILCIEPNPPAYGCNFVVTSGEGAQLVRRVASTGFRLHLDAAGMALVGEDVGMAIRAVGQELFHFHASEPHLSSFAAPTLQHTRYAAALQGIGYAGWISIEMRATDTPQADVRAAVQYVKQAYAAILRPSPAADFNARPECAQ